MLDTLFLNLGQHDVVTDEEKAILHRIIQSSREFGIGEDLVVQGSRPNVSTLLVEGFAARYKHTQDGSRQITAINVTGDFVDLHAFLLKKMDHGIVALSDCRVAFANHSDLKRVTETAPHLTRLLWLDTLVDGAIHREWIVAMGRRSVRAQLAHLVCELYVRLSVVGQAANNKFYFPLSQAEIADVLGISLVHMNRSLQRLRSDRLLSWSAGVVTINKWNGLAALAEFDPTYLSLTNEPR